jgi:hypothetical protein
MALSARPFGGVGFLQAARTAMNTNGGFLGAQDGAFRYAFIDGDFFHLKVLRRAPGQRFTEAAIASGARVAANGQTFARYCLTPGPCAVPWQGQVISAGAVVPGGTPATAPRFRYFGQVAGISAASFLVGSGDPSAAPATIREGIGRLLPLVTNKAVSANAGNAGTFWSEPPETGKVVYGLARSINATLVLVQQDGQSGLTVAALAAKIAVAGIDEAVMGDGSDSAALAVDGVIEVTPGAYLKDRAIPVGLMFIQHHLGIAPAARLENSTLSSHPDYQVDFACTGIQGRISISGPALELELSSLGLRSDTGASLATDLGAPNPLVMRSTAAQFTNPIRFVDTSFEFVGRLLRTPATTGVLRGQLKKSTPSGDIVLDANLPLVVI